MPDLLPLLVRKPALTPGAFPPIEDAPAMPPISMAAMGGTLHDLLPAPTAPNVALNPRISAVSSDPLLTRKDAAEADLYRRNNPIAPTTTLGKIGHVAAGIGNVLGNIFAPDTMSLIPGTSLYNEHKKNQDQAILKDVSDEQTARDQRGQVEAQTAYTNARPGIEQSKLDQKQRAAQNRLVQGLKLKGFDPQFDEDGTLTDATQDPDSLAYHAEAAKMMHDQATAERQHILAGIGQPGTPMYEDNQRKLAQIDKRISIADKMAGIAGMNSGLRRDELTAHAFGTIGGQELAGALHDEGGQTVGTWNANNVKPTTQARDAAVRAEDMTGIQSRIEAGMKDPEIMDYMGPVGGRLAEAQGHLGTLPEKVAAFQNDLVSYGAFQAGLHPVRGIGALQYFDKVMGGLHQTPEQLRGKLTSNAGTSATVQQAGIMPTTSGQARKRSAPNAPSVPSSGPKVGAVEGGYRFTGGNASDPKNWVKQ